MAFRSFEYRGDKVAVGSDEPKPELRQIGPRKFILLHSFCYVAPKGEPDEGTVYIVPGEDAPDRELETRHTVTTDTPPRKVVVPPTNGGGETDLASVPPFMWWLIASYGNHTRAALLHDALYVEGKAVPPVSRANADRLFLAALREPGQKRGVFRHWLMWAAVSVFGNIKNRFGLVVALLFGLHVFAVWTAAVGAVAWKWGGSLDATWWKLIVYVVVLFVFLAVLGTSWRAGVDLTGGWLSPTLLLALLLVLPLVAAWPSSFELWSPFGLLALALGLMAVGMLWGLAVAKELRWWLWPTALIGLPISMIPVGLIFVAIQLVWCVDLGAAVAAMFRRRRDGQRYGFELPSLRPFPTDPAGHDPAIASK